MPAGASSLERRITSFIREYGLVSGNEMVLVAVSGGPDSVCLLHLLNSVKNELGIELHIAHLDHGLRGEESEAEANYVCGLAEKLGIPVTIEKGDVEEWSRINRMSLEEAAREVRYRFLGETARNIGASRVAVGHTRDDQVETTLMHYLRGAGIQGLRGLRSAAPLPYASKEDGIWVIRPLLGTRREETALFCQALDLQPRLDPSNKDTRFLRNKVRLELIPLLKQYNSEIEDALVRLADLAGEDTDFIDEQALKVHNQVTTRESCMTCLDSGKMRGLPLALQRRIFRIILGHTYGSLKDVEAAHVDSLVRLLFGNTGKCVHLPDGVLAANERSRMVISDPGAVVHPWPILDQSYTLNVPGDTTIPGWRVTADIINENYYREDDIFSASFDLSKAGRSLQVRGRKPGDRFHPLGMAHSRKLQDFMVDSSIPRTWRDTVPLVCSPSHIIWVVGWRMDERVKVTTSTEGVLRLEFHRSK
ncbi:MAG: tRNA lysidine(34) synthetase TilS [Dehalococcoidia bacterium]|nr:tRNA lysidine(34) synthetase TilS [Dehalococcoidia bacterium]